MMDAGGCPEAPVAEGGNDGTGSLGVRGLRAASGRRENVTLFRALT